MKKQIPLLFVVLLIAILTLSLVACGKQPPEEAIYEGEYYNSLTEQEKVDFDSKLNTIVADDEYIALAYEDKVALLNRLVESEKLIKEVALEESQNAVAFNNVKKELSEFSDELSSLFDSDGTVKDVYNAIKDIKGKLQEIVNSDMATNGEIVEAQKRLENIDKAEQQYVYFEAYKCLAEAMASNLGYRINNPNIKIYRLKGVYALHNKVYMSVDFIKEEIVAGVPICFLVDQYVGITTAETLIGNETYQEILDIISNAITFKPLGVKNTNQNIHQKILEKNESIIAHLSKLENKGYELKVVESWDYGDANAPSFMIEAKKESETKFYILRSTSDMLYRIDAIERICPEFWAGAEIVKNN